MKLEKSHLPPKGSSKGGRVKQYDGCLSDGPDSGLTCYSSFSIGILRRSVRDIGVLRMELFQTVRTKESVERQVWDSLRTFLVPKFY
jgi:hypothetical protein